MTDNEKLGYVLTHCEIENREGSVLLYTENMVTTFAGRSFVGVDVLDCVQQCVEYFDNEIQNPEDSWVKTVLKDIGW